MDSAHAHLSVTDAAFDRVVGHLTETLTDLGVAPSLTWEIVANIAPLRPSIVTGPPAPNGDALA